MYKLKYLLLLTLFFVAAQTSGQAPPDTTSITGLKPTNENCAFYLANSYWLPDAYIHNATCACLKTPDEPKANRIRIVLKQRMDSTSQSTKQMAAQKKLQYTSGGLSKRAYNRFVKALLTPIIYADHVVAYQTAGCKGTPAPLRAWRKVSVLRIKNCNSIWWSIKNLGGSCNCNCRGW